MSDVTEEQIEISDSEIKSLSESTGINKKYIEKSVELDRADKRFKSQKRSRENKEKNFDLKTLKDTFRFIQAQLIPIHTTPNFATVTSVNSPKDSPNEIILKTETEYPKLYKDKNNCEKMQKSFRFNISNDSNLEELNNILDYVGVNAPSELENKEIPTKPLSTTNHRSHLDEISYEIHNPKSTILGKFKYKSYRALMRLNCYERQTKYMGGDTGNGRFALNRNIYLLFTLLLTPFLFINYDVIKYLIYITISPYLLTLFVSMLYGMYEIASKKSENRDYIKHKLKK